MIDHPATWFVTGCSKGLGRAIAQAALDAGHRVVATARDPASLADLVAAAPDRVLALPLDVTVPRQSVDAVAAAQARFGGVDVVINNAGYGYVAAIEEGEEADVRALIEADVLGPWHVLRAALPGMRARGRGHVVNVTSVGGLVTFPAVGFYHLAKFALEGLSATLAQELAPFGIGVTAVAPGAFRTDFRGGSMRQSATRLPDYAATAGKARDAVLAADGQQRGDPARAARAIVAAVESPSPPRHLVLGPDALQQVRTMIADLQRELDAWEATSTSTDFAA